MSAVGSSSSDKLFSEILSILESPIGFDPLVNAVTLTPCAHKINESEAIMLYGQTNLAGFCSISDKKCAVCRTIVTGWSIDHTVRQIAQLVLKIKAREESIKATETIVEGITKIKDEQAIVEAITKLKDEQALPRYLWFTNLDADSLIEKLYFGKGADGVVRMQLFTRECIDSIADLLVKCNIKVEEFEQSGKHVTIEDPCQIKQILFIFSTEIPSDQIKKMQMMLESSSYRAWRPLRAY